MQYRAIIMDMGITIEENYPQPKNNAQFPYDLTKERQKPALVKPLIANMNLEHVPIQEKY